MTQEELAALELAEYEQAMERLIEDPMFMRVLVQTHVTTKPSQPTALMTDWVPQYNFNQGLHSFVFSVVAWMEQKKTAVYYTFIEEVHKYEYRRRESQRIDAGGDE